jgi:hypothetical protein
MALKNAKLHQQFAEDQQRAAEAQQQRSGIFQGITIHVNGLTHPSHHVRLTLASAATMPLSTHAVAVSTTEARNPLVATGVARQVAWR